MHTAGHESESESDVKMRCQASVPRDAFPPTPPGPEGSNGNGLLRVQWVPGAWLIPRQPVSQTRGSRLDLFYHWVFLKLADTSYDPDACDFLLALLRRDSRSGKEWGATSVVSG